jgi:hypothetical protein
MAEVLFGSFQQLASVALGLKGTPRGPAFDKYSGVSLAMVLDRHREARTTLAIVRELNGLRRRQF